MTSKSDLLSKYKSMKESREKLREIDRCEEDIEEKAKISSAKTLLKSKGIDHLSTNGYWYKFVKDGKVYELIDQDTRVIITRFDKPETGEEQDMIDEMVMLKHQDKSLFYEISKAYNYDHFIDDRELLSVISSILR